MSDPLWLFHYRIAMAVDLRLDVDATEGLGASLAHEAQRGKFQQSCQ